MVVGCRVGVGGGQRDRAERGVDRVAVCRRRDEAEAAGAVAVANLRGVDQHRHRVGGDIDRHRIAVVKPHRVDDLYADEEGRGVERVVGANRHHMVLLGGELRGDGAHQRVGGVVNEVSVFWVLRRDAGGGDDRRGVLVVAAAAGRRRHGVERDGEVARRVGQDGHRRAADKGDEGDDHDARRDGGR